jgi:hypothetical protein
MQFLFTRLKKKIGANFLSTIWDMVSYLKTYIIRWRWGEELLASYTSKALFIDTLLMESFWVVSEKNKLQNTKRNTLGDM